MIVVDILEVCLILTLTLGASVFKNEENKGKNKVFLGATPFNE